MNEKLYVESTIRFKRRNRGEKVIQAGEAPQEPPGRVPRISRMMALAIWFDELIRKGEVKNFAELAAMGQVCRTRVSQIMNLLLLAPDIQEEILFLGRTPKGQDTLFLKDLQEVTKDANSNDQRQRKSRCLRGSRVDN